MVSNVACNSQVATALQLTYQLRRLHKVQLDSVAISCVQERLAEINAERAAKKLAAHQAAEQKLKEAAMPARMQLAAQVLCPTVELLSHCTLTSRWA